MNQKARKIFAGLGYWTSVLILGIVVSAGMQFAKAAPSSGPPYDSIGAPLTTGARDQRKTGGGIIVDGNTLGIWAKGSGYGVYGSNAAGDYGTLGNSGYGGIFSGATTGAYGVGGTFGVRGYVPTSGSQGFLGYHSVGAYGAGEGSGVQGYNTTNLSNGYLGYGYDGYNIGVFGASSVRAVYGYNTAYGSGATLGYYDSGLYARNSANYYTYLDSGSWGMMTNGNMQANDYYIAKIGKWMSQLDN